MHSRLRSRGLPAVLMCVQLTFAVACSTVVGDYIFRAVGTVVAEDGSPLPGVRVTIRIYGPVYRVIDLVSEDQVFTDGSGRFHFDYISHQANPPYTLVFEHSGFKTETVEGAIQEMNPHKVVMRRSPSHPQASDLVPNPGVQWTRSAALRSPLTPDVGQRRRLEGNSALNDEQLRYHDFHLKGYAVSEYGRRIDLDLVYDYPDDPLAESRITFSGVACYSFTHPTGAIITEIQEVPLDALVAEEGALLTEYGTVYGLAHWRTDLPDYLGTLKAKAYRAWRISSAIGFAGFVIAAAVQGRVTESKRELEAPR